MGKPESVLINDAVYGACEIAEPVLIELLQSPTMLRLKGINQLGIPPEYDPTTVFFSRFDHSAGVMVLLRNLGTLLNEQVAGLLHDSSHTAFSHLIDWVLQTQERQDYQDKTLADFLTKSEVPAILSRHGLQLEEVIDHHRFPLLEQEAPKLCADRVDYALRELVVRNGPPARLVPEMVAGLTVLDKQIIFNDLHPARCFGWNYRNLQQKSWGSRERCIRNFLFARVLREAMAKGALTLDDFWQDDTYVLQKIHPELEFLRRPLSQIPEAGNIRREDLRVKQRLIDPAFKWGQGIKTLSEVWPIKPQHLVA